MEVTKIFSRFLENRPDNVQQQSMIRIVMLCFLTGYFYIFRGSIEQYNYVLMTCLGSFVFAFIALFGFNSSKKRNTFKITTAFLDMAILTYMIYLSNDAGSPLIFLYLWITFGNGLRFGKQLLFISTIFSIISFSIVINFSEFWQEQKNLAYGFFIITVALSLYISLLITKLHAAVADAKAANEAKTHFLSNMSHEIRTPLNGIIGMSSMLSTTDLNSKQKDYSSTIYSSANTLLSLINNILDISKIEAGMATVEMVDFDLHELINSITQMLAPQAKNKGVDFKAHISPIVPMHLHGNEQYLRQILINLIGNATKFTNEGSINVNVTTISNTNTKAKLRFEVTDTGIGISDKAKPTIFEKFTQADESETRRVEGSGLGMAIAKQLVESMNGVINFSSRLGVGSSFWFEVEFDLQENTSENKEMPINFNVHEINESFSTNNVASNLNILVAEDNETNQKVIISILEHGNHHVTLAKNGEEALDILEKETFDIIILDMQMPVMGGLETARIFRFMYPDQNTPILILTANATTEAAEACKKENIDAFLTKPVEPDKLLNTLSMLVKVNKDNVSHIKTLSSNVIDINKSESKHLIQTDVLEALIKMAKEESSIRTLIEGYLHDTKINIDKIEALLSKSEYQQISDLMHMLDGSSSSIGAKKLAIQANKIFELSHSEQQHLITDHIDELSTIFDETKIALENFLDAKIVAM